MWLSSWPNPLPGTAEELVNLIREQHCQILVHFDNVQKENPQAVKDVQLRLEEQMYYVVFQNIARKVGCSVPEAYFAGTYIEDFESPAFPHYSPESVTD